MKEGFLAFGFFIILGLLSGCNQQTIEEIDTAEFKQFMKDEESGFVALTYYKDQEAENMAHVTKALKNNKLFTKHFSYVKQNTKNDRHFLYNNGIEQNTETLAYYKKGVLWEEFNFPREWDSEEIMKLHKFVKKIKIQES
ncbi:hypothetical protein M3221_24150 [Domibacillus indicus]|uniref:hypothetical protein n=1 Tax=Domibacillus indicus TaxID=1437523 RepID=UPI00203F8032|nr:hypothetical protein [Domibacillus indicus]MCM3791424.1 hypothetical protein [Domibacillus indicus]